MDAFLPSKLKAMALEDSDKIAELHTCLRGALHTGLLLVRIVARQSQVESELLSPVTEPPAAVRQPDGHAFAKEIDQSDVQSPPRGSRGRQSKTMSMLLQILQAPVVTILQ
jgi:hypothetical protein